MLNLHEELANWNGRLMRTLASPSNVGWAADLLQRGSMLRPPVGEHALAEHLADLGLPADCPLANFYRFTNGLDLPCMDAEDGEIVGIEKLEWLRNVPCRVTFPVGQGLSSRVFTRADADVSLLLTPMIDSAFFVTVPSRQYESWALFHHGDDRHYASFSDLILGETRRIESSLRRV